MRKSSNALWEYYGTAKRHDIAHVVFSLFCTVGGTENYGGGIAT